MSEETARSGRRRVAPWIALGVAAVFALLFVFLAGAKGGDTESAESPLLGKIAPAVSGTTIDGTPWELSRRKGSWVVLNFFNTTCLPCKAEHPELVKFAEQQQSLGVNGAELYTVTWGVDSEDAVKQWFADNGGDWPIVRDPNGSMSVSLGVAQVPETWIVDPQGVIVQRIPSQITADALSQTIQKWRDAEAGTS